MDREMMRVERGSVVRTSIHANTTLLLSNIFKDSNMIFTGERHHDTHPASHILSLSLSLYPTLGGIINVDILNHLVNYKYKYTFVKDTSFLQRSSDVN